MFIDTLLKRTASLQRSEMWLFGYQMFRSGAWKLVWVVVVYKHLVPLGPKNYMVKTFRLAARYSGRTSRLESANLRTTISERLKQP